MATLDNCIDLMATGLVLAASDGEALQRGLAHRQANLLALEASVQNFRAGRSDGRELIDQAEDIRRPIAARHVEQLDDIRRALDRARAALQGTSDSLTVDPRPAALGRMLATADREGERASEDLAGVVLALTPTAQCIVGRPDLVAIAQRGVVEAARQLESARRAVFHVAATLPGMVEAVRDLPSRDEQLPLPLSATPSPARRANTSEHELHRAPTLHPDHPGGISMGR